MTRRDLGDDGVALVQHDPAAVAAGTVEPLARASVPIGDRGFLYGDAVFETLRCYGGEPAHVDRHGDRLASGLEALAIPFEPPGGAGAWLAGIADRLVAELDGGDAYVRVSVTRGPQEGLLDPTETAPTVAAIGRPLSTRRYGAARVASTAVPRPNVAASHKTHNYLPSVLARHEAMDGGGSAAGETPDEALMRGPEGGLVSGAASNLVARVEGRWLAPLRRARPGVARSVALDLLGDGEAPVVERPVRDAGAVEAMFLTNTTWGVRPVAAIDGRQLTVDAAEALRDRYLARVAGDTRS